jgi:hypothetical protein
METPAAQADGRVLIDGLLEKLSWGADWIGTHPAQVLLALVSSHAHFSCGGEPFRNVSILQTLQLEVSEEEVNKTVHGRQANPEKDVELFRPAKNSNRRFTLAILPRSLLARRPDRPAAPVLERKTCQ